MPEARTGSGAGHGLLHRLDELGAPPARRVELLLVLVQAALAAGDAESAAADASRPGGGRSSSGVRAAPARSAHVALAGDRLDEAQRLASAAVTGADRPEVECEALEVLAAWRRRRR
jgi:hypothetical protein